MSIPANLERLRNRIDEAAQRADRNPASVRLMAVSKMHPVETIAEAYAAGQRLFGENRIQEAQSKAAITQTLSGLELHLIGPLQNNKVAKAAEIFAAIDTLDSLKTAQRLQTAAAHLSRTLTVLVEVKLSHEDSKHGVLPEHLPALLTALAPLPQISVAGLLTVPPWSEDPETARPYFAQLRRLRDENVEACPTLTELSMGMSNDFEVAIEEGSTTVRLGTAIFGKRTYA